MTARRTLPGDKGDVETISEEVRGIVRNETWTSPACFYSDCQIIGHRITLCCVYLRGCPDPILHCPFSCKAALSGSSAVSASLQTQTTLHTNGEGWRRPAPDFCSKVFPTAW